MFLCFRQLRPCGERVVQEKSWTLTSSTHPCSLNFEKRNLCAPLAKNCPTTAPSPIGTAGQNSNHRCLTRTKCLHSFSVWILKGKVVPQNWIINFTILRSPWVLTRFDVSSTQDNKTTNLFLDSREEALGVFYDPATKIWLYSRLKKSNQLLLKTLTRRN